jgi:C4-dicarboxylate-specific signal transduction histidine kinase
LFIGETVIGRISGVPILPISRRVDAADGTFLGVLVVLVPPSALTSLHKTIDLGRHGVMTLILAIHRADSGGVALEVRDTGTGMTAAEVTIALEAFGQVDGGLARRHNGTGLGLPLARQLTELHGGSLTIDSEKGHCTTIIVALPAVRGLAAASVVVGEAAS